VKLEYGDIHSLGIYKACTSGIGSDSQHLCPALKKGSVHLKVSNVTLIGRTAILLLAAYVCDDCLLLWSMLWQGQSLHDICIRVQVAISYLAMLIYIAVALGYIPSGARPWAVLVTGRASLGLGGVIIVLAAVAGALGLCSLFGMWSTLIIMEASPSAVLCMRSVRLSNCSMCGLPSRWCPEQCSSLGASAGASWRLLLCWLLWLLRWASAACLACCQL